MKKSKQFLAVASLLICFLAISLQPAKAQVEVSLQLFYDDLSPYGSWVYSPQYGNVWVPEAGPGFRPYFSGGHWVYTENGWLWASTYDWGWAPFHYGTWVMDHHHGWMWVPGYEWAPAQVTWGYYSGYYGWAPLGPGISYSTSYYPAMDHWVFMEPGYMTVQGGWGNHYYVARNNRIVFNNNVSINVVKNIRVVENTGDYHGRKFSAGPRREEFRSEEHTSELQSL